MWEGYIRLFTSVAPLTWLMAVPPVGHLASRARHLLLLTSATSGDRSQVGLPVFSSSFWHDLSGVCLFSFPRNNYILLLYEFLIYICENKEFCIYKNIFFSSTVCFRVKDMISWMDHWIGYCNGPQSDSLRYQVRFICNLKWIYFICVYCMFYFPY